MSKIERLFNLLALLLDTRHPVTVHEIREKLPEYGTQSDEAFHRMFERDKAELREIGYVIEQTDIDAWGTEIGYRIGGAAAVLEDPGLTGDEIAALSLAAQAWGGNASDGALGVLKLSVGSAADDPGSTGWLLPRVAMDRDITTVMDAIVRRKRVHFSYRTGGGGDPQERRVEPYGLFHRGAWYLAGFDLDRDDVRHFKLARVDGLIDVARGTGPDFDPPPSTTPAIPRGPWEGDASIEATIAFAPEVAWWAERRTGAQRIAERDDGRSEVRMPVGDLEAFAGWLAGFGDRALVVAPSELRDAVVAHLRATLENH